ncbi:type-1 angiotensin II receptor-associated protein-like [Gigantopelta aegis]|uniref:type-1 angiotensin II receptor-associated protein-like n=1 Tax=Gigantopelta aegis TaxID=1735272 RepID=UPI001B88A4AD|nr:type-1 angiotensin II receptor-associated protein-like [Gigantopelta aegis]
MSGYYLPPTYLYMNGFMLAFGFWGIVNTESSQPILMFLVLLVFSVIQDCIFIGIYQPRGYDTVETRPVKASIRNEFRFSLGMSIVNLLIKPVTGFLLFRIMKSRDGDFGDLNIPGINRIPTFGGSAGTYENIDSPAPYSGKVETATGYDVSDKPVLQP